MKIERIHIPTLSARPVDRSVREESGTPDVDAVRFDENGSNRHRRDEPREEQRAATPPREGNALASDAATGEEQPRASLDIVA